MPKIRHCRSRVLRFALAAALLPAAGIAGVAGAATPAPARPASAWLPVDEAANVVPPLLPPMHGIDVPNRVTRPAVRHVHEDAALGATLTADRPKPKGRNPVGKRGVAFEHEAFANVEYAPWLPKLAGTPNPVFEGISFDTNGTVTDGGRFIPPDPHAAVGPNHVVTVTNVAMQVRTKAGALVGGTVSLKQFFASLAPQTFTFDPKVHYDEQANRWVLVTLEQTEAPDTSFIFLAVSATPDPTGTWFRTKIDARRTLDIDPGGATDNRLCWGDYPGFGYDEQAVYVALNMFAFGSGEFCFHSLLWIVEKQGFYQGATADVRQIDPYDTFSANPLTTQVARIRGTPPPGTTGTWLVGFDGLSSGSTEFVQVARLENPLGADPVVRLRDVSLGDISQPAQFPGDSVIPGGNQPNNFADLDAGDRRTLDAVWRDDTLWATFTTNPPGGTNRDEPTAHWIAIDTDAVDGTSPIVPFLRDQGDVGGEQLGGNTHTYYPAIDVNARGHVVIGFSASSSTLEAGAYAVSRRPSDAAGTTSAPVTIRAGDDPYLRTFGDGGANRWGDYSAVALDPVDQCFWVYNEYAADRGSSFGNEDGRWGTAAGRVCACDGDEATGDVDLDGICADEDACPADASNQCADVAITKTDGRTSVDAGASVTYSIVATNSGNIAATGAVVTDNFPAPLNNCAWTCSASAGSSCPSSGSNNIAATVNLAVNGSATFTATCGVSPTASGTLANTATIALANEANTGNNAATDTTAIVPRADLSISKTDNATLVDAGEQLGYTIVATNTSNAASSGTVADAFAAPLTSCTWSCSPGAGSGCPANGSGSIAAPVTLAANGRVTFTARCTVASTATGTISNTATVAGINDANAANDAATDSNTVVRPRADVSITVSDGRTAVDAGTSLAYTIVARNAGSVALAGVAVSNPFPGVLTGCAWTCNASPGGSCASGSGGILTDSVTLAAGGTATYTATCDVPATAQASTLVDVATVAYGNDPVSSNDSASDADTVVRPRADLSITKNDGVTAVDAGRAVTYAIEVRNLAASAISGASIADAFPAPLSACTWRCTPSTGSTCTAQGSGPIADTIALAANGTASYVATCTVPLAATGTLANTATVDYPNDPSAANDSATDADTAIVPPIFVDSFE